MIGGVGGNDGCVGLESELDRRERLGRRIGAGRVIAAGLISLAGGLALLSLADADTPYPLYAAVFLVTAAGMGLSMPMLSASILGALPHSRAGLGSGLGSAAREVGCALGVAVMGTVLTARFTDRLPDSLGGHADSPGEAMTAARASSMPCVQPETCGVMIRLSSSLKGAEAGRACPEVVG